MLQITGLPAHIGQPSVKNPKGANVKAVVLVSHIHSPKTVLRVTDPEMLAILVSLSTPEEQKRLVKACGFLPATQAAVKGVSF